MLSASINEALGVAQTSENESSNSNLWNAPSNNAHSMRIQGSNDVAPSSTGSQAYSFFISVNGDLIQLLQIDENTRGFNTGPAWVWGMAATANSKFCLKKADDLQRLGYVLSRSRNHSARRREPACFGPSSQRSVFKFWPPDITNQFASTSV